MTNNIGQLRFGGFVAPFHANRENPTLALERDLELGEHLDRLGYEEIWFGEHHSAGYENIGSPELMIAALARSTKHIRMGTGVNSLSYHHPLILADRIVQLDHQTRGRIMFGAGPGQLPSDAFMLGIQPADQRRMMGEALEVIIDLFNGETVDRDTDWFKLREGRLHVLPYQSPSIPIAVASAVTPSGPALAGRLGAGMLSLAASTPAGFEALRGQWSICEAAASEAGKSVTRDDWRITTTIHVAETREQAMRQAEWGIMNIVEYYRKLQGRHAQGKSYWEVSTAEEAVKVWTTQGMGMLGVGVVGTPDDAAAKIRALQEQSGGFGCFLHAFQNIASFEDTKSSVELFARYVTPQFRRSNMNRDASLDWANANSDRFIGAVLASTQKAFDQHKPAMPDKAAVAAKK